MKETLLLCVLFLVTYNCESYGPRSPGILGGLIAGAQDVGSNVQGILEGITNAGLNFQGHLQVNPNRGNYKPQVPNNYGKPENPVETIIVIVEEDPPKHQYGNQGQYGPGYGYRPGPPPPPPSPHHHNRPNFPHNYGYNDFGGNQNNRPWNQGNGHRPYHHHRPGYGYNPQGNYNNNGYYNGNNYNSNQVPNEPIYGPNNNGGNSNQNSNDKMPTEPQNRPFDRPINNNFGNIPTDAPNRPFDRPINNGNQGIPTSLPSQGELDNQNKPILDAPNRPFDRPINNGNQGIPTSLPNKGELDNQNKPNLEVYTKRPEPISSTSNPNTDNKKPVFTTMNDLNIVDKTTKKPEDDDDLPLFVPLHPNQYVYGGDKIEINAPKRETNDKPEPAEEDYSHSNIDPLDIRFGEKEKQ